MNDLPTQTRQLIRALRCTVFAAVVLFISTGIGESFAADSKPNILFIEVDDLHYMYLGCMGNKVVSTPSIDRLAKQGVLFPNAVCQGTMCGPSRNSLITGTYPHNLGFYKNGQCGDLPKGLWAFPKALQRSGYKTYWIGKSHVHVSDDGIEGDTKLEIKNAALGRVMGFDHAFASVGRALLQSKRRKPSDDSYLNALNELGYFDQFYAGRGKPSTLPNDVYMDGYFTKRAIDRIQKQEDQDQPFFLWLNLSLPHGPLDPPQSYHTPYSDKEFRKVIPSGNQSDLPPELVASKYKPNKDVQSNQRQFGACVTFIDDLVAKLVESLEQTDLRENTMIVFFSDHGVMMADHGLHGKGTLFKETLNPSLIVSLPAAASNGNVETRPVELLDILKTSLELAGASQEDIDKPYGESLLPLLTGKGEYERKACVGEMTGFYAIVTDRFKYINNFEYQENKTGPVLFDLEGDPDETRNVAADHPKTVASMQAIADQWLEETQPVRPPNFYSNKKKK
jgi:arylsulfatase A-like enzyme